MMANNDPAGSMMSMMASGQPPVRASSTTPRYGTSTPGVLAVKFATEFRMPVSLPAAPRFQPLQNKQMVCCRAAETTSKQASVALTADLDQVRIEARMVKHVADLVEAVGGGGRVRAPRHAEPRQAGRLTDGAGHRHRTSNPELGLPARGMLEVRCR